MEALSLKGKVAIVTGSSSGIGTATAKLMARRGAQVTLHGRNQAKLDAVKEDFKKAGIATSNVIGVIGDITDAKVREKLVSETLDAFSQIDILVNNAGAKGVHAPLLQVTQKNLYSDLDLLLNAPLHLSQLCHPHLAKTKGNIVNVSSIGSKSIIPGGFSYCCAKASLDIFSKYAAAEFGGDGIRVNVVSPGLIKTPLVAREGAMPEGASEFLSPDAVNTPLGIICGEPEDVAEIIAFYASDAARLITGDNNVSDAGISLPFLFKMPSKGKES